MFFIKQKVKETIDLCNHTENNKVALVKDGEHVICKVCNARFIITRSVAHNSIRDLLQTIKISQTNLSMVKEVAALLDKSSYSNEDFDKIRQFTKTIKYKEE